MEVASINNRIKELRKAAGMTLQGLGDKIGLTPSALSYIESGKSTPSNQTVLSICRVFGASEHWLRTGEGDMYVKKSKDEEIMEFFNDVLQDEPESFRRQFVYKLSKISETSWAAMAQLVDELTKEKE